ncbi:uncharacterized protein LOC129912472 isoform X2 [Episyrphus balteatus]|nr:uncharacterized protein LOC129912472 isoform X2 [Episyrphus balteatus]
MTLNLNSANISLAEVTLVLAREYLSSMTSTLVIAEHSIMPELGIKNILLMEYVLQHLNEKVAVQLYMHDYSDQPLEYYIFVVDSLEAFKEVYHSFMYNFYERHYRFLIVLTKYTPGFRKVMEEIFILCYHYDVIDANIITDHPKRGVAMYTYFLYSENVCRGCLPELLYSFNDGFGNLKKLFPEKLNNFHRCPIKVTSRYLPPFFTLIGNTSDPQPIGNWENLSGIEGTLLKFLAEALNFTIDLRPLPAERSYVKNNQSYGCFKQLEGFKVDIAIGCFIASDTARSLYSPTSPHHHSPYMYLVKGKRNLSAFGRLGQPFSNQLWILVAVFFIMGIVFILSLKHKVRQFVFGEENENPVTNFVAIFLGYSVIKTPRRNFARFIFYKMLSLTLVLRNAYQGSLYDAFRMDRFARCPTGYDDLIKWNYTLILPPETAALNLFSKQQIIVESDGYEPRLKLLESLEGNYATVVVPDGYSYYLEKSLRNGSDLFLIPEAIYNYQFVMFLPKHSIYLNVFNKKLKEFACAGITSKLSSNFTLNPLVLQKLMEKPRNVPLSNNRLLAMYEIYGSMIVISGIVFGLELLSVKYRRLERFILRII